MDLKSVKKTKWQLFLLLMLSEGDTVHLHTNYRILATSPLSLSLFFNCRMTNVSRSIFFHTLATGHSRKLMFIMT